ncbi:hypothetical protein GCM10027059_36560 [Myceligenerans halotolerans]
MTGPDGLIDALTDLAGPLGPFTTPEQRRADEERFLARLNPTHLDDLLDIVSDPGPRTTETPALVELLEEAVTAAGRRAPERVLERVVPMLTDPARRPFAIDVLGSLRDEGAIASLDRLVHTVALTDDELERVACSLGDIGGPAAGEVLSRMRTLALSPSVTTEIVIATDRIDKRAGPRDDAGCS